MAENVFDKTKGAPVDARVVITVGDSGKDAFMAIYHAENGGKPMTYEWALSELRSQGVTYGVNEDAIRRAVEDKSGANYLVAKWLAPVAGEDGTIKYLFSQVQTIAPKETENGYVDYRNLGHIQNIRKGTVIAEITLPTEGTPGKNVKGVAVPQTKGVRAPYVVGKNVTLSEDETKLIASCDGHLRWESNKFVVDDVVTIQDVDASIGNIDFIGSVIVKGNVMDGFKVSSKKDITINGNASGADIAAGGNLVIKSGSINSTIICHGDVTIGFCENSKITCDGKLTADAFIGCDVYCGGEMHATGKKGVVLGGKYIVLQDLYTNTIGSESFAPTDITIGDNAVLAAEKASALAEIEKLNQQLVFADQVIVFLATKRKELGKLPPEKEELLMNTVKSRKENSDSIEVLKKRIEEIATFLEANEVLSVYVNRTVYPGTRININNASCTVKNTYYKCKVCVDGGEIVFQNV